jgi:hypothetical protein
LKDRNTRLQDIIEQMNTSFLHFNDSAVKSELLHISPALAQQLKQVTESFIGLAKAAAEGNEGEDEGSDQMPDVPTDGRVGSPTREATKDHQAQATSPLQRMDIGWGYSATAVENPYQRPLDSPTQQYMRRQLPIFSQDGQTGSEELGLVKYKAPITTGHLMDQGGVAWTEDRTEESSTSSQLPFGLVDILSRQQSPVPGNQAPHIYSVHLPTPNVSPPHIRLPTPPSLPSISQRTLPPHWTYSHDETTFARRLSRASLETGFHLLCSANQRPTALNHVFKLSLPYMSLEQLRERFMTLLTRGTDADLDCWETPFIHLGGAGTHYQRKDAQGNIIKMLNTWTVRRIGPIASSMIRAENVLDPSKSHDLNIDLTGFEGEWYDAYDVEGYLEHEKGVRIDPKDSFAEVIIDDDSVQDNEDYFKDNIFGNESNPPTYSPTGPLPQSDTPSFNTSRDSTPSSTTLTPDAPNTSSSERLFANSDAPFGLDMEINSNNNFASTDVGKMPNIDPSTYFDQPLGLDLAPGFDLPFGINHHNTLPPINYDNEDTDMGTLGLDMMGAENLHIPVVRQKKKKAAWVDVSKLIDGT